MSGHRFQLFLRSADTTVSLTFPEDTVDADEKMIMPGDDVDMVCDVVQDVVAEVCTRFTLREGEKTSKYFLKLFKTTCILSWFPAQSGQALYPRSLSRPSDSSLFFDTATH